jgi:PKD repeat protein
MKKIITLILILSLSPTMYGQFFSDNFESYTVNDYLGTQSSDWTTWSNSPGSSEDVYVVNTNSFSGTKSIYFNSPFGGGPNDVVLPFNGVNTSGHFKFKAKFMVPSGRAAYFNFQGGASTGSVWSMDLYMRSYGTMDIYAGGYLSTSYTQGSWFELSIDADLDNDLWEFFIDGKSIGTVSNANPISYIDIYPAESNTEFWMDDVEYCIKSACNPELSIDAVTINPNTICTYHSADVTVKLTNNSSFSAKEVNLGIDVGNDRITKLIKLNSLAGGKDTSFTIPNLFVATTAGASIQVKAINLSGDLNPANDTAKTTVTVNKSPSNTTISKGTPFKTTRPLSTGTKGDPDVVASGDVLNFDINAPSGYLNSNYSSKWIIAGFTLKTTGGSTIPSSYYTYATPSGSTNAKFSFTPDTLLNDSVIVVSFTVRDVNTTCDSSLQRYIYVAPRPKAIFTGVNACDKVTLSFTNNSTVTSGALTYAWDFGDATKSDLGQPTKLYGGPGTYIVKLKVTTPFGYSDSMTQTVNVYPIPVANFEFVNECEGKALKFTDISTLPSGTPTYTWDYGTNPVTTGNGATTTKQYAQPGIYNVKLTVTVNGCDATTSKFVTQAPRAIPDFTFTPTQCDNNNVVFTNASTAPSFGSVSYLWRLGDNSEASSQTVSHTYNNFQVYNVTLVANTDLGCADSVIKQITLRQSPTADFSNTIAKCTNQPITFTNNSVVPATFTNSYDWEFGDGNVSTDSDPVHDYVSPGTYLIVLKSYSSNGCSSTTDAQVTINQGPTADFIEENVCKDQELTLGNNSFSSDNEPLTYLWKFGNGDSSTVTTPTITYTTAGNYDISLEAKHSVNGCATKITKSVTVFDLPMKDLSGTSRKTGDGAMLFTTNSTGAGYSYLWYFGDGGTSRAKDTTYIYNGDGVMTVTLVITSGDGCVSTVTDKFDIFRLGVKDVNSTANILVYPNPSVGNFVVDFSDAQLTDIKAINVTDIMGREIANNIAIGNNGLANVNLTNYAAGIYYLNIVTAKGSHTVKLNVTK